LLARRTYPEIQPVSAFKFFSSLNFILKNRVYLA
jgi:hypothetical protein